MAKKITEDDIFKKLDFTDLKKGDIVQNLGSGLGYTILETGKESAVAIRTVKITNPSEWRVIK